MEMRQEEMNPQRLARTREQVLSRRANPGSRVEEDDIRPRAFELHASRVAAELRG
jgi:hypothetical protein